MYILAIDPGTRCVGWSMWRDGVLLACGLVRSKERTLCDRAMDMRSQLPKGDLHSIVEKPKIYPRDKKRQPNDLIDLALVAGVCATTGVSMEDVTPSTWKGQVPKEIQHKRVLGRLSEEEAVVVKAGLDGVPKSLQHNVLDAVGIGQWYKEKNHG